MKTDIVSIIWSILANTTLFTESYMNVVDLAIAIIWLL